MKKLEVRIQTTEPPEVEVSLVDAMFLARSQTRLTDAYGNIAESMLQRLSRVAPCVHVLCDSYTDEPTIKNMEQESHGASSIDIEYSNLGYVQKRPRDFQKALQSSKFKKALLYVLVDEWQMPQYGEMF